MASLITSESRDFGCIYMFVFTLWLPFFLVNAIYNIFNYVNFLSASVMSLLTKMRMKEIPKSFGKK